jgi:hypothetical protein
MITDPKVVEQAEAVVQWMVAYQRNMDAQQEAARQNEHFCFAVPDPQHSNPTYPAWTPYRVYPQDLPAFAVKYGVSEKALLRVARGEVNDVNGVRQGRTPGNMSGCIRRTEVLNAHYKDHPQSGIRGPFGPAVPLSEMKPVKNAGCFLPIKTWTPE